MKRKGQVTIPSEKDFLEETKELMALWGADAIRDSDGTKLDEDLKKLEAKIYTTYFVARNHNEFIEQHQEETQQIYLLSERGLADTEELTIESTCSNTSSRAWMVDLAPENAPPAHFLKGANPVGFESLQEKSPEVKRPRGIFGALGGIRTPDLLVRSQVLYPAELQAHI